MARKSKKGNFSAFFSTLLKNFSKRRKRKGKPGVGGMRRFFRVSIVSAAMLFCGFVFYFFQPPEAKEEIRYLSQVYWTSGRKVSIDEFARDLWNLYFARNIVESDYQVPGESPVYGGIPCELPKQKRRFLQVLRNRGYWVGYDEKLRNPAWVAYRVFAISEEVSIAARPESFLPDERTVSRVSSVDYTGSGFDRGHLAPNYAIARCYGREAQEETFLMSNIVPQRHALNAGLWKQLEAREADNYALRFREIWVITGPVFRQQIPRTLPSGIPIPDAFYKIYLDELMGKPRAIAFLIEHTDDGKGPLEKRLCSIDSIQNLTGLDFFPELPAEAQEQLEKEPATRVW
jgi:endonuclease G